MVEDAYVNHIPVMTGESETSSGEFYSKLHPTDTADLELIPFRAHDGTDQLVDVVVSSSYYQMDWMLPALLRRKRVEVPVVAIIRFRDGKLAHEHIYWDQAVYWFQLGCSVRCPLWALTVRVSQSNLPSNALIDRNSV